MKRGRIILQSVVTILAVGFILTFTARVNAQIQTKTTTEEGAPTKQVEVERGEVVYVSGNHLIVKMENGEIRDIPNVPESARATVDGREIGIHDVKVGMKLEKTITTTSTPRMVIKTESVTGKVFHVSPPNSLILTMENNQNKQFKIPKDQKFNVDGQMVDAFALKPGMRITATKVTETPETVATKEAVVTGKLPPPPPPPPEVPILIVYEPRPTLGPVETAEATPAALPKTGSHLPAIGLLGALLFSVGLGLRLAARGKAVIGF